MGLIFSWYILKIPCFFQLIEKQLNWVKAATHNSITQNLSSAGYAVSSIANNIFWKSNNFKIYMLYVNTMYLGNAFTTFLTLTIILLSTMTQSVDNFLKWLQCNLHFHKINQTSVKIIIITESNFNDPRPLIQKLSIPLAWKVVRVYSQSKLLQP